MILWKHYLYRGFRENQTATFHKKGQLWKLGSGPRWKWGSGPILGSRKAILDQNLTFILWSFLGQSQETFYSLCLAFKQTSRNWTRPSFKNGKVGIYIYIYACCEVIIWAKFGHFRCYYLGQVGVTIWAKLFLAYKNSGSKRFLAHTVIILCFLCPIIWQLSKNSFSFFQKGCKNWVFQFSVF